MTATTPHPDPEDDTGDDETILAQMNDDPAPSDDKAASAVVLDDTTVLAAMNDNPPNEGEGRS